jgi:hypothetical protein
MMALFSIFFAACALLVTATGLYDTLSVDAQEEAGLDRLDGLIQQEVDSACPFSLRSSLPRH